MAKFRERILIYVDGASVGNPGHAGIGIVVYDESGNIIYKKGKYIGEKTSNEAEYMALLESLNIAPSLCTHHIIVHSDSQLVIKHMNRQFRVRAIHLLPLHKEIRNCESIFKSVEYILVPRENKRIKKADKLASSAISQTLNP